MKVLLELLGDAARALSNLEDAGELRPESREKLKRALNRIVREGEGLLEAIEEADESGARRETSGGELVDRALAAMARDQHAKAEAILERGIEKHPDDVELFNHLGLARWERGEIRAAESAYRRAMEVGLECAERAGPNRCREPSGEYLRALEGRALCLYRLEHFDAAFDLFRALGSLAPAKYGGCHYLAGEIRHLQGRPAEAAECYERSPEEPSVHYNLGLARYEVGEREAAVRVLVRGFAANPYIAASLLDRDLEEYSGPGGYLGTATYAAEFLEASSELWERSPGAVRFLERCFEHPAVRDFLGGAGDRRETEGVDRQERESGCEGAHRASRGIEGVVREVVGRLE